MRAYLKVTKMEGPVVGASMRGVRFIEFGLIQNGDVTNLHGNYDGFAQPKKRVLSVEGHSYLDVTSPSLPWYSPGVQGALRGTYAHGSDPAVNPVTNIPRLEIEDTPSLDATDQMVLTVDGVPDAVDSFAIEINFQLYLAVCTKESVLGSAAVYTQRGRADWWFNGSGTVDAAGVWQKGMSAKNDGSASFVAVTDGSVVPITTGTTANDALVAATWSTQ
jgi:hypothetical protein